MRKKLNPSKLPT